AEVMEKGLQGLSPAEFEVAAESTDALVLDVRGADDFCQGFVPRSINIGLAGDFAPWVGALIADVKQPLLLVVEEGKEEEAVTRLARVGFDNVLGYLKGGIAAWKAAGKEIDTVCRINATEFKSEVDLLKDTVVDVRKETEYRAEHVAEALCRPLASIDQWFVGMNDKENFYLHCAGGYRSMIAASILKAKGIHNFKEVAGGFKSIAEAGVEKTNFVCQSKLV
ncbi:MAG: rhodanese-like domain-containing protein, partial [Bacteroidia bacterium]